MAPTVGKRVAWTSRKTGMDHAGVVIVADNGLGAALVRPDGDVHRWTAWVPHGDLMAGPGRPLVPGRDAEHAPPMETTTLDTTEPERTLAFKTYTFDHAPYAVAWGARAILDNRGATPFVDLLGDRMDSYGPQDQKDRMFAHLNRHMPRSVLNEAAAGLLGSDNTMHVLYEDDVVLVVGSPQASYGYLYITAVLKDSKDLS